MCRRDDTTVVALADDLSGAAEVAALLGLPARLALRPADLGLSPAPGEAVVVDLDSRYLDEGAAAAAVRAAVRAAGRVSSGAGRDADGNLAEGRAFRAVNSGAVDGGPLWFKKCDSLLRGPVGAEAAAFAEDAEVLVVATALPAARRVVRGGVVLVDGVPLHESAAWRAEERAAPRSVAGALAPLPVTGVPLETVRRGPIALAGRFREVAADGRHPVCDAETDTDLTVIATAAALLGPGVRLLGSGGLAAALGRLLTSRRPTPPSAGTRSPAAVPPSATHTPAAATAGPAAPPSPAGPAAPPEATRPTATTHAPAAATAGPDATCPDAVPEAARPTAAARTPATACPDAASGAARAVVPVYDTVGTGGRGLLVVAGSAEPVVGEQVGRLVAAGARHVVLAPGQLAGTDTVVLPAPAPGTVTVVSVDGAGGVRAGAARAVVAGLARAVSALPGRPDLVLTGGETARRVLDALGVTTLRPVGEIHHGAVHCTTTDGRSVVTRPGSFGGPDSFVRIAAALRPSQQGVTQ
ncbi:four-carbon acid sugar kinase family protein [Streptomyces sp. SLBN-134]|uniref:four-carbon acid sugar kinase family protein n=1 Tax=Streptomyces sp. SLBN-134 TaxID=2768456 RepID=UPI001170F754|nr:four-carbon acid sugar kinase family protein [Streptomyces sp. SLBN-134]TQL19561.1 putative nucleotide-binding sugar-metabolising enzyme [Streptomyces sp. SLBN-134]